MDFFFLPTDLAFWQTTSFIPASRYTIPFHDASPTQYRLPLDLQPSLRSKLNNPKVLLLSAMNKQTASILAKCEDTACSYLCSRHLGLYGMATNSRIALFLSADAVLVSSTTNKPMASIWWSRASGHQHWISGFSGKDLAMIMRANYQRGLGDVSSLI